MHESVKAGANSVVDGIATNTFVQNEITSAKSLVQTEIRMVKLELIKAIRDSKAETIRCMFTFWISAIGIAILFYFLKR